jgi:hypothetical protein
MTITADNLNRTKKLLLDSGEVTDMENLDEAFAGYGMVLRYSAEEVSTFEGQLALITMMNLAVRSMDGQVEVQGPLQVPLVLPGFAGKNIAEAAAQFGVSVTYKCQTGAPVLALSFSEDAIAPVAAGWRAAAVGVGCKAPFAAARAQPVAITAAAALAVNEAFHVLRNDHLLGGKRVLGLNLWRPDVKLGWDRPELDGPDFVGMTSAILVLGLGHLGQAYLWTLGMQLAGLEKGELWLQDDDYLTDSTWSTSILTPKKFAKQRKARLVARAMESIGFETRIVENRLMRAEQFTVETPKLVLFGVDNPHARRLISRLPVSVLVEAGLGERHDTFRGIRAHSFPQAEDSAMIWAERPDMLLNIPEEGPDLAPAYRRHLERTKDRCGTTTLASKSVGVPFVGCFAAALVLSEFFRRLAGEPGFKLQETNLRDIADRDIIARQNR